MDMKPCPFCGGTTFKIDKKSKFDGYNGLDVRFDRLTFSVRCNICHARGGAIGGVVPRWWNKEYPLPDFATTKDALIEKAVALWNNRVSEVDNDKR